VAAVAVRANHVLLRGHELIGDKRQIFLDRVALADGATDRVWVAPEDSREEIVDALGDRGEYLLLRRESPTSPPNYALSRLDGQASWTITSDEHPAPGLAAAGRLRLEYLRGDGTELSASLYLPPGTGLPVRVHGAFVADHEVHEVVDYLKQQGDPDYLEGLLENPEEMSALAGGAGEGAESDPLYDQAVEIVVRTRRPSISLVQRHLRIGYNRAARLIEDMERAGLVSSMQSNGNREVLVPATQE